MKLKPTMFLIDQPDTTHANESNNRLGGLRRRGAVALDSLKGETQPDLQIGDSRLCECKWEPSVEFEIPDDWLSGVYLGTLTTKKEWLQSYVIFIVRDDRPCDLLLLCSDTTWAAYNSWSDDRWSLYHDNTNIINKAGRKKWSTGPDTGRVSFFFGNIPCPIRWSSKVTMCRTYRTWIPIKRLKPTASERLRLGGP